MYLTRKIKHQHGFVGLPSELATGAIDFVAVSQAMTSSYGSPLWEVSNTKSQAHWEHERWIARPYFFHRAITLANKEQKRMNSTT